MEKKSLLKIKPTTYLWHHVLISPSPHDSWDDEIHNKCDSGPFDVIPAIHAERKLRGQQISERNLEDAAEKRRRTLSGLVVKPQFSQLNPGATRSSSMGPRGKNAHF